jgi:AraC-like DNA-binding protein
VRRKKPNLGPPIPSSRLRGSLAMGTTIRSAPLEVAGHRSDLGRWRAAQRPAGPHLCDYVLGYFASEGFLPRPLHERHLPALEVVIVLNFAAPHRIIDPSDPKRTTEHRNAWIVALQQRHHIHEAFGARDFMVIRFTPIGAQMLLGAPMDLLTDRTLALEDLDSRFSRLLTGHAEATHDWAARFDVVENIIAERLASAPPPPVGLLHSWRMLQESPNHVDLARLPEEFGCSRRHLIAQFHTYFGMAPKTIARISRFHLAIAAVHRPQRRDRRDPLSYAGGKPYLDCQAEDTVRTAHQTAIRWTDLALGCGYYDQSHFINEFRSFSGLSPLEFLRRTRHE